MYKIGDVFEMTAGLGENKVYLGVYQVLKDIVLADLPKSLKGATDTLKYLLEGEYVKKIDLDDWNYVLL